MRKFTFQISVVPAVLLGVLITGAVQAAVAKRTGQTAKIKITTRGYEPTALKLRKGIPAHVTFLRTTDATCVKKIDSNIRHPLPLNQPVLITFTPAKKASFTFVYGMNRMRGELMVQ